MQFILDLIQRYKNFLLFFILELIALLFTIQLHSYHRSKFINSSNFITGSIYENFVSIEDFIGLKEENTLLNKENEQLYNQIERYKTELEKLEDLATTAVFLQNKDSVKYHYISASVINNEYHHKDNFITLSEGEKSGVKSDMAVVNSKGIVGIVTQTSSNYSVAISVLNKYFKTNARFKKSNYFGTISWDGKQVNIVQLQDIPRQANIQVGDTIVTGGKSAIFPKGVLIGSVKNIEFYNKRHHKIDIQLFNDFRKLNNVQVIENLHREEIINLENNSYE